MNATTPLTTEHALHIVVRVRSERFAFPVVDVEEALDAPVVEWVPVAPPGMLGQLKHRGRMVPAWDAAWAFGLSGAGAGGARAALVLRDASRRVALIVDDVVDMARIETADVRAVPAGADLDGILGGVCFSPDGASVLLGVVRVDALAAMVSPRGTFVDGMTR